MCTFSKIKRRHCSFLSLQMNRSSFIEDILGFKREIFSLEESLHLWTSLKISVGQVRNPLES